MIFRGQTGAVVSHQIGDDDPYAVLFVVQHDRGAAGFAGAKFERTIRIICIERLTVEIFGIVHGQVGMFEKHNVGCVLSGDRFAHRAMAGVIVDWVVFGLGVDVVTSAFVF